MHSDQYCIQFPWRGIFCSRLDIDDTSGWTADRVQPDADSRVATNNGPSFRVRKVQFKTQWVLGRISDVALPPSIGQLPSLDWTRPGRGTRGRRSPPGGVRHARWSLLETGLPSSGDRGGSLTCMSKQNGRTPAEVQNWDSVCSVKDLRSDM
jgi:hypothetical protein